MHWRALEAYIPGASASICEKKLAKPLDWSAIISMPHKTSAVFTLLFPPNSAIVATFNEGFFKASAAAEAALA